MVESLVKRVARAMAQENDHHDEFEIGDFRDAYMDMARAAIEAMREPTEDMYRAVYKEQDDCAIHNYGAPPAFREYWSVAIDAALNEQVSG